MFKRYSKDNIHSLVYFGELSFCDFTVYMDDISVFCYIFAFSIVYEHKLLVLPTENFLSLLAENKITTFSDIAVFWCIPSYTLIV